MKSKIGDLIDLSGFKKKHIAKLMGISQEQLSRWISGNSHPTLIKAFKLAEILNCKVDDLYEKEN